MKKTFNPKLFYLIFVVGMVIGWIFNVLAAFAGLEASFYGFDRTGGSRLTSLSCPIFMTTQETNSFTISINNSTDRNLAPSVSTFISSPGVPITSYESIKIASGETKVMEWKIGPENIDLKNFIFVRARVFASYPLPDREGFCGVYIFDLPGRGWMIVLGMVTLSLTFMFIGWYGLRLNRAALVSSNDLGGMAALGGLILFAMICIYFSVWFLAILSLAVSLLFFVVMMAHILKGS
jgi:hypothetical protein